MNEFGEISIDSQLIPQTHDLELIEINNGSIFCSCLHGSFIEAMIEFSKTEVEILLIEASGLADPSSIITDLEIVNRQIGNIFSFGGNICIIDSQNFFELFEVTQIIERQIKCSSMVVINKIDLVNHELISKIKKKVATINSALSIKETKYCKLYFDDLIPRLNVYQKNTLQGLSKCLNTPNQKQHTITLKTEKMMDLEDIQLFLKSIITNTNRIKGFLKLNDGWYSVNGINKVLEFNKTNVNPSQAQIVIIFKMGVSIDLAKKIECDWNNIFTT